MKKRVVVWMKRAAALAVLAAVGIGWFLSRTDKGVHLVHDLASAGRVAPLAPTGAAPKPVEVRVAAPPLSKHPPEAQPERSLTQEESAVLDMYENIASVFDLQGKDCHELGLAVE